MSDRLKLKMKYTLVGYLLCLMNLMLIQTKFNLIGIGFGFGAVVCFIKALSIKQDK